MQKNLHRSMAEATRLTCEGRLGEATDMIQQLLSGGPFNPAARSADSEGVIIDVTPRPVEQRAPSLASPGAGEPQRSAAPQSKSFQQRSYTSSSGKLAYWLYTPGRPTTDKPLVVMLHGCTQSAEDFARGTRMNRLADEFGFVVAYPQQSRSSNPQGCWNWFKPGDQQRDLGEPALIAGATQEIVGQLSLDPGKVFIAGLSAGGAAAAIMAETYPDIYAAVGIHSGLACGSARDLPSAILAMKGHGAQQPPRPRTFVPVITFHGDRDTTVSEINSRHIVTAAAAATDAPLRTDTHSAAGNGGRRYTRQVSFDRSGRALIEEWTIHGAGHAWAGGDPSGSYTDPTGPDASREMLRFFLASEDKRARD
jgi:poly(hydroxyalkanoate) depolymerase family esterase